MQRRENRDRRWRLKRRLWEISGWERLRKCGRVGITEHGGPVLRVSGDGDGRVAGYAGLARCGSPHVCPTCAPRIGAVKAADVESVVAGVHAEGGSAALLTLTLRHHAGQPLAQLWDAVTVGWRSVVSGRAWQRAQTRFGVTGWVRAVEVTYGAAGWHPHCHVVLCFDTPMSAEMVGAFAASVWPRWERAVVRRGFSAVEHRGGLDVRVVNPESAALGDYLQKIALEVAHSSSKRGREGSRTPFEILEDGLATGNADDLDAWFEYERSSRGRKALTWANGTRERYGVASERTDQDIVDDELGTADDDVMALPARTWREMRGEAEMLLAVAERDGAAGAVRWLRARGLDWISVAGRPWLPQPRGASHGSRTVLQVTGRWRHG